MRDECRGARGSTKEHSMIYKHTLSGDCGTLSHVQEHTAGMPTITAGSPVAALEIELPQLLQPGQLGQTLRRNYGPESHMSSAFQAGEPFSCWVSTSNAQLFKAIPHAMERQVPSLSLNPLCVAPHHAPQVLAGPHVQPCQPGQAGQVSEAAVLQLLAAAQRQPFQQREVAQDGQAVFCTSEASIRWVQWYSGGQERTHCSLNCSKQSSGWCMTSCLHHL